MLSKCSQVSRQAFTPAKQQCSLSVRNVSAHAAPGKGFGANTTGSKKEVPPPAPRPTTLVQKELQQSRSAPVVVDTAAQSAAAEASAELKERLSVGNWIEMSTLAAIPDTKNYKIVELVNNKAIMIWRVAGGQIFTTDAYSTAYKFPLVDAKVQQQADGSFTVTVPLDGTVYDLATGKVLKWCPGGNALQSVLQSMKKDSPAIDLPVYNTIVTPEGKIMVDYQNVLGV